jgi:hypothetical protein
MPIEVKILVNREQPYDVCPACDVTPFVADMRGIFQRGRLRTRWSIFRGRGNGYCAVICERCAETVGYEYTRAEKAYWLFMERTEPAVSEPDWSVDEKGQLTARGLSEFKELVATLETALHGKKTRIAKLSQSNASLSRRVADLETELGYKSTA